MKHRIGAKAGNLARVLAVVAIVMMSTITALVSLGGSATADPCPIWDINCDGEVNYDDLALIGLHWGETGAPGWIPEDCILDGTIDVLDMGLVGQHWTGDIDGHITTDGAYTVHTFNEDGYITFNTSGNISILVVGMGGDGGSGGDANTAGGGGGGGLIYNASYYVDAGRHIVSVDPPSGTGADDVGVSAFYDLVLPLSAPLPSYGATLQFPFSNASVSATDCVLAKPDTRGDVNADGYIDELDSNLIKEIYLLTVQTNASVLYRGDANGDGNNSVADYLYSKHMRHGDYGYVNASHTITGLGDVDGDGGLDIDDYYIVQNIIGGYKPTVDEFWRADRNCDGDIDVSDLYMYPRYPFSNSSVSATDCVLAKPNTKGDINADGYVDPIDYYLCRNMLFGRITVTPDENYRADANGDGSLSGWDYSTIRLMTYHMGNYSDYVPASRVVTGLGDVDGDGVVTTSDFNKVFDSDEAYYPRRYWPTPAEWGRMDANCDGYINSLDVTKMNNSCYFANAAIAPVSTRGDINADGYVDEVDYDLCQQIRFGTVQTNASVLYRADANGDGAVNIMDYSLIKLMQCGQTGLTLTYRVTDGWGDGDCNGLLELNDKNLVKRYMLGYKPTVDEWWRMDISMDGYPDSTDIAWYAYILAGLRGHMGGKGAPTAYTTYASTGGGTSIGDPPGTVLAPPQGFRGGQGNNSIGGGGGGGAGELGFNGSGSYGGKGGNGSPYDIKVEGVDVYYAGGGGGAILDGIGGTAGLGGQGGGGAGNTSIGENGITGTGGGGGGGHTAGGIGGSGIVIIRYLTSEFPAPTPTGGTPTPTPTPTPYIPPPPSDGQSIFTLPVLVMENESYWEMWALTSVNWSAWGTCEDWASAWGGMETTIYYVTQTRNAESGLARSLYGFDTSSIPDDAVITDAYLRAVPYTWGSSSDWDVNYDGLVDDGDEDAVGLHWGETGAPGWIKEDVNKDGIINVGDMVVIGQHYGWDYTFVLGGTHNASVLPVIYQDGNWGFVNYNESEFYGNFGEFNTSDIPVPMGEENFNSSSFVDIPFNAGGLEYINVGGRTTLSLRAESDINHICPVGNGSADILLWTGPIMEYWFPDLTLVVNWYQPPIIEDAQISAIMTIQAILFTLGGLLGILLLILRPEIVGFGVRMGLLLGLTIMTIIGVSILESIIVAMT